MKDQKARQASRQRHAIANDYGMPPIRPPRLAVAGKFDEPTLTEIFNRAAKQPKLSAVVIQPVTKKQIEDMRRKLSQPRPTLEFGVMGSVNNARNPNRDRSLLQTMAAMKKQLDARKGLKNDFARTVKKGEAKGQFNRVSKGMGM